MTPALAVISAMITPALLILASASLVATALVRLGRVVDRSRILILAIDAAQPAQRSTIMRDLARHERRARFAERTISLYFVAVVVFVTDCLSIGLDAAFAHQLTWLPVSLTILGMVVLIAGSSYMVAESREGSAQILEEIARGRDRLASAGANA